MKYGLPADSRPTAELLARMRGGGRTAEPWLRTANAVPKDAVARTSAPCPEGLMHLSSLMARHCAR